MKCSCRAAVGVALHAFLAAAWDPTPTIQTQNGPIQGFVYGEDWAFLGVPYAQPPVGSLRWAAPVGMDPRTNTYNASTSPPPCVQFTNYNPSASEDCLYLDIIVPAAVANRMLASPEAAPSACGIVDIHGGGFVVGDADPVLGLAQGTNCVTIAINYRLGLLGYMALEGMSPVKPAPPTGTATFNVGLLDQQAALAWAHANFAAFGADPGNVLVMGQSAGGESILYHYTLEDSFPYYRAALSESPGPAAAVPLAQAYQVSATVAGLLDCNNQNYQLQLECLRGVDVQSLIAAGIKASNSSFLPLTQVPCVDGTLVKYGPSTSISKGDFNKDATLLIGGTLFEGDSLLTSWAQGKTSLSQTEYDASIQEIANMIALNASALTAVHSMYDAFAVSNGYYTAASRAWGDSLITCNLAWAAQGASNSNASKVYRYLVNTTLPQLGSAQPEHRATHGTDTYILWNTATFTPVEQQVQANLWDYLVNAAFTGNVNTGSRPVLQQWPAFVDGSATILAFNERAQYTFLPTWQQEYCAQWWSLLNM